MQSARNRLGALTPPAVALPRPIHRQDEERAQKRRKQVAQGYRDRIQAREERKDVEALDRLSRDMEDLAGIHKRLTFRDIEIRAVHDGVADTVTIGLRGLVGQLYREDGAKKVRRGMAAVIRDARHAGGRAYGYRPVRGERGKLAIVDAQATIVRRIFAEWNTGRTARDIAHDLNRDRASPPRGQRWNASTIYGNATRRCGRIKKSAHALPASSAATGLRGSAAPASCAARSTAWSTTSPRASAFLRRSAPE